MQIARRYSENAKQAQPSVATLRDWLQGRWALLFSHPDDFASYGFEMDRWIVHVSETFAVARVSALALTGRKARIDNTWVNAIGGSEIAIRSSDAHRTNGTMQARERTLISTVISQTARFVLIVDESLRPRRTYAYSPLDRLASPIDLAWMAHRLRERTVT